MMPATAYAPVNDLLDEVLSNLQTALADKLIGLYLYGSLVLGDFDLDISDIDLVAVLKDPLTESEFAALDKVHIDFALAHPRWKDRLEIAYLTSQALQTFKTQSSQIAVISPGEPFHYKEAGIDWLVNWYMVRETGLCLYGASAVTIIPDITQAEYIQCVRDHMQAWPTWIDEFEFESRPSQAYVILTLCRGLYTLKHGTQPSKLQAARWAQSNLVQWAELIENALMWRQTWREDVADPGATLPETRRFVHDVIDNHLA